MPWNSPFEKVENYNLHQNVLNMFTFSLKLNPTHSHIQRLLAGLE